MRSEADSHELGIARHLAAPWRSRAWPRDAVPEGSRSRRYPHRSRREGGEYDTAKCIRSDSLLSAEASGMQAQTCSRGCGVVLARSRSSRARVSARDVHQGWAVACVRGPHGGRRSSPVLPQIKVFLRVCSSKHDHRSEACKADDSARNSRRRGAANPPTASQATPERSVAIPISFLQQS